MTVNRARLPRFPAPAATTAVRPRARRLFAALALLLVLGPGPAAAGAPGRVVSINLCTDQLLLLLAEPGQVLSVSHLARDPAASFVAAAAAPYPVNRARVEELIALDPDLILAHAHSSRDTVAFMRRLGYRVEELPAAENIDDIRANIEEMARLLGAERKGRRIVAEMERRLARVAFDPGRGRARGLFYQPRGYTSGSHTLQDAALAAAGWENLAGSMGIRGYSPVDLEQLLLAAPDQLFTSPYARDADSLAQRQLRHPALRKVLGDRPLREIDYRHWICGGPMIVEAVEALAAARPR